MSAVLKIRVAGCEPIRRGQEHLWATMMEARSAFTVGDIYKSSAESHRSNVSTYMRRLENAGYIERTAESRLGRNGTSEPMFCVSRRQSATPVISRQGDRSTVGLSQQNMWNVMRRQRAGWTASELAVLASTDDVVVARATALAYSTRLAQAGALIVIDAGKPGTERCWRLKGSADTGPKPPKILRSKLVYDQNTSRILGDILAEEDRP
ncbi:hypothetical protein [Mesorhizobium sp. J428]|uniref:hypothetical protein n=1 Tax=Mesorhizobium sp. J428 TaxID=2898440 RepID=UPI00215087C6|nr:hypothetical protein [Mesorhizobium sp. J428]MCR5855962.1 hypothetical protein [Mesorhizobium sp. J428]